MAGQDHLLNMATMVLWALPVAFNPYDSPKRWELQGILYLRKLRHGEAEPQETFQGSRRGSGGGGGSPHHCKRHGSKIPEGILRREKVPETGELTLKDAQRGRLPPSLTPSLAALQCERGCTYTWNVLGREARAGGARKKLGGGGGQRR